MVFTLLGYFVGYSQLAEVFPVAVILFAETSGDDAGMNADAVGEGFNAAYAELTCEKLFVCGWRD